MANRRSSVFWTHGSDANFRDWGNSISTALSDVGLVKTSDTGQINWASVTRPAVNTVAGYEIWRFNDSLQSTRPIFIRFEFGTAGVASYPALSVQVGTGTNGSGTLTGLFSDASRPVVRGQAANSVLCESWFSSDGSGFASIFAVDAPTVANSGSQFSVERFRDADGTPNNKGFFMWVASGTGITSYYWAANHGTSEQFGLSACLLANIPRPLTITSTWVDDSGEAQTLPLVAVTRTATSMSKMVLVHLVGDLPFGSSQEVNHFGADREYISGGTATVNRGFAGTGIASTRISNAIWWAD